MRPPSFALLYLVGNVVRLAPRATRASLDFAIFTKGQKPPKQTDRFRNY